MLVLNRRRKRVAVLSLAGMLCVSVGGAFAAGAESNPLGAGADVVTRGRHLYNETCTVCHGVDGAVGDRAPALGAARSYVRRTDAELFDAVRNGIPGTGMPPTSLGEDDVWRVVAYIRSLRARAADLPTDGDRENGAALFWGQAECGRCHMVHGRGGLLGPDLSDVAARLSLRVLREALTVPKPHPPKGYEPATITTNEGERISGVLKNRHNFSYQLLSEDGRLHMLSVAEVAQVEIADRSLMPADYDRRLSALEFRDLLAYLTRLAR
jgi:putative heme-binding domain-containing protein